jgi:uncharacterized protein
LRRANEFHKVAHKHRVKDYIKIAKRIELQEERLLRDKMKLLIIILCTLMFAGCADNNLTMKGVQAFDSENYTTAYEELAPLAVRGDPEAQFYVAKMHYFGFGIPKDLDIAFIRYTDSAEQGYMKAQHNLGLMYMNGESTDTNPELGYEWIAKAAAQGLALSQVLMGIALTSEGSPLKQDITRGLEYYKAAALQNYPSAFTLLGEYFSFREHDFVQAGEYYDKGAALGDPGAMHRLSYVYMGGTLRTQDKEKAHNLLKTSAEKKYLPSYYDLAMSYMWGNGVKQNVGAAINWLKKSAVEANDPRAMESLAQTQLENRSGYLTQVSVLDSIESGVELRKKAAELGNALAQLNLFVQYYNGTHVPNSKSEAIKWLKASSENGNPDAQFELAKQYLNGWDVPKDQKKGISLYESAAESGHDEAILALGFANFAGIGTKKNNVIALDWFKQLPEKDAALGIGLIYAYGGNGITQNREIAEMWFKRSDEPSGQALQPLLYMNESYGTIDLDRAAILIKQVAQDLDGSDLASLQGMLGELFSNANNLQQAYYWLDKASMNGDARAQLLLGELLLDGTGIERDIKQGRKWLSESARQGYPFAALMAGNSYLGEDIGGNIDLTASRHWLRKSVQEDNRNAQLAAVTLALTYLAGLADPKLQGYDSDLVAARYWLELAEKTEGESDDWVLEILAVLSKAERNEVKKLAAEERRIALKKARDEKERLARIENKNRLAYQEEQRRQRKAEKTNWFGLLVGAAIVGYAVNKYEQKKSKKYSSKSYDFSKTHGMSSSDLGMELLRQKQERGISGRGYVAPFQRRGIGYDPNSSLSLNTATSSSQNSNLCSYFIDGKTVSISKQNSWTSCPSNLNIPNRTGNHFDLSQMGQSSGTPRMLDHGRSATSADYCYYSGNIQIPKANYGSCPSNINY